MDDFDYFESELRVCVLWMTVCVCVCECGVLVCMSISPRCAANIKLDATTTQNFAHKRAEFASEHVLGVHT